MNNKSPLKLLCENQHIWKISYNHFMKVKECPDCKGFRRPYKYEEVKGIFEKQGCTLLETEYINNRQLMKYKCVCGNDEAFIRLTDFLRGTRCKVCANHEPYTFEEIKKYLNKEVIPC